MAAIRTRHTLGATPWWSPRGARAALSGQIFMRPRTRRGGFWAPPQGSRGARKTREESYLILYRAKLLVGSCKTEDDR